MNSTEKKADLLLGGLGWKPWKKGKEKLDFECSNNRFVEVKRVGDAGFRITKAQMTFIDEKLRYGCGVFFMVFSKEEDVVNMFELTKVDMFKDINKEGD